jgi:hypothetical protein
MAPRSNHLQLPDRGCSAQMLAAKTPQPGVQSLPSCSNRVKNFYYDCLFMSPIYARKTRFRSISVLSLDSREHGTKMVKLAQTYQMKNAGAP